MQWETHLETVVQGKGVLGLHPVPGQQQLLGTSEGQRGSQLPLPCDGGQLSCCAEGRRVPFFG